MYRYIVFYTQNRNAVIVDGLHLLWLCQESAKNGAKVPPAQSGAADNPLVLGTAANWLWGIANYKQRVGNHGLHLNLAGRLIKGNQSCYISDDGPVWRKGVRPTVNADPTHPAYHSPHSVSSQSTHDQWMKTQVDGDPSYQKFAQRIVKPSKIFNQTENAQWLQEVQQQTLDNLQSTPMLCNAVKDIMAHRKISLTTSSGKHNRHYSRIQHMFPVLVGAMFLAEPVRNIRAWPINLMLLDLAAAGQRVHLHGANITWKNLLWHPQALEVSRANPETKDNPVDGRVIGPTSEKDRTLINIATIGKLHLVGGLMPASPTGGGKFGKSTVPSNKKPSTWGGFDFIHQKEIDILLSWLKLKIPRSGRMTVENLQACGLSANHCVNFNAVKNPQTEQDNVARQLLTTVKTLIEQRVNNLA